MCVYYTILLNVILCDLIAEERGSKLANFISRTINKLKKRL